MSSAAGEPHGDRLIKTPKAWEKEESAAADLRRPEVLEETGFFRHDAERVVMEICRNNDEDICILFFHLKFDFPIIFKHQSFHSKVSGLFREQARRSRS